MSCELVSSDYVWKVFAKKSLIVVDFGAKYDQESFDSQSECHFFGSLPAQYETSSKVFVNRADYNLDDYCQKMEIGRISLLRTAGVNMWPQAQNMLWYTDVVEFVGTDPIEFLKTKGFKYFYGVIGESVGEISNKVNVALRVEWEEACLPLPNLGIMCINLEKSTQRREFTASQLNRLGFPYKMFKAIDGNRVNIIGTNVVYYGGRIFKYSPIKGRHLSYGELGCVLSHYFVYKALLETSHDYFLVLEDDNRIVDINLARQQLMNIPSIPFDLCLLSGSMNSKMQLGEQINPYYSKLISNRFNRANSLLFTRSGLEKTVEFFEKNGIILVADDFLEYINLSLISTNENIYMCAEDKFSSDIWNVYRKNETYEQVLRDKPLYNKFLCATTGGYSRMGNGLFQYALLKAQSLEKTMAIALTRPDPEIAPFPNMDYIIGQPLKFTELDESKFTSFQFSQEFLDCITPDQNFNISGYFQSEKYFAKYKDVIKNCFEIDSDIRREARCIYSRFYDGRKMCGVHVRLADFRGDGGFVYAEPSEKYFQEAMKAMPDVRYLVCSNDMEECMRRYKHIFPVDTVYFSGRNKFVDFSVLSFCDHNILTAGSFSWWAGYLNKNPNKIVVGMKPLFNRNVERTRQYDEKDYYPSEWMILEK